MFEFLSTMISLLSIGRMQNVFSGNAPLAQLVEQLTLNQWVPGSNP